MFHPLPVASWQNVCEKIARYLKAKNFGAIGRGFIVRDLPKSEEELRKYPPFEFENWQSSRSVASKIKPKSVTKELMDESSQSRLWITSHEAGSG